MTNRILYLLVDSSLLSGISRHVLGVVQALAKEARLCDIAVCTVFPRGDLNDALAAAGVRTYSLGYTNFNSWRVFGAFRKVFQDFRPDIVHIHVITFWQWVYLALFARRVKKLFTAHSDYGRGTWQKQLLRRFLPLNIDKFIFVSKAVRDAYDLRAFPGEVIVNCPPRTGESDRGALSHELKLPKDTKIIGTACALREVKRPRSFVRIMAEVLRKNKGTHAVVLGDGDAALVQELKAIVEEHGVADRFHFMGYRSNARELIAGFHIFIVTSEREGMPTAMLEAMSAGVPVAFMKGRGGLRDLSDLNAGKQGPFGIVVEDGDEAQMVQGVCELMSNPERWSSCSERAKNVCQSEFNFDVELKKLMCLYNRLSAVDE